MIPTSPRGIKTSPGDLVVGDFEGEYMLTYSRAPISTDVHGDIKFYRGDVGVVIESIVTPDSCYTTGFVKLLLPQGLGWVPSRWLSPAK